MLKIYKINLFCTKRENTIACLHKTRKYYRLFLTILQLSTPNPLSCFHNQRVATQMLIFEKFFTILYFSPHPIHRLLFINPAPHQNTQTHPLTDIPVKAKIQKKRLITHPDRFYRHLPRQTILSMPDSLLGEASFTSSKLKARILTC